MDQNHQNTKKRGAPFKNKNAVKAPELRRRKTYYRKHFFGQRWEIETGERIAEYLRRTGKTEKQVIDERILPHIEHELSVIGYLIDDDGVHEITA